MQKSAMFRKESLKKLSSQSEANINVDIVKPAWWLIFAALAVFTAGLLAWCFMGSIPISYTATGIIVSDSQYALCCVPPYDMNDSIGVGSVVNVLIGEESHSRAGSVAYISRYPLSADELSEESTIRETDASKKWLVSRLLGDMEYAYLVAIDMGESDAARKYDSTASIRFVLDDVRPMDVLMK